MESMYEKLKELFKGKTFVYTDKNVKSKHFCKAVEIRSGNYKIICDRRTFVKKEYQVQDFIDSCVISNELPVIVENEITETVIIREPLRIDKMSEKLEDMFNLISAKNVSKEDMERAKLMVGISNQVVNIEKVKLMYQSLSLR